MAVNRLIDSQISLFWIDFFGDAKTSSSICANPIKSCSTSSAAISIIFIFPAILILFFTSKFVSGESGATSGFGKI